MNSERKRALKKLGKAEVERRSTALHQHLQDANPVELDDPLWASNYARGVEKERWISRKRPTLHREALNRQFVVRPYENDGWRSLERNYIQCTNCGSALPSLPRPKILGLTKCKCWNIVWWRLFKWNNFRIKRMELVQPVKLTGRG